MQDIRKKHLTSKSNFPVSREIHPRADTSISHIGLSGGELKRPRFISSDSVSLYKKKRSEEDESDVYERPVFHPQEPNRNNRKIKNIASTLFFILIFFSLYYTVTYIFDRATVTIVPNYKDITLSNTEITLGTKGDIPFEITTTEAVKTKTLPKTTTTTVDKKASGEIIIYNDFATTPQRLVKFTRFESTSHKIYKIADSVVIPAKKGDVQGEIKVKVFAESEGPSYNIDSDTFTIPGFKGKDQYTKITAKTAGVISGGASGSKAIVAMTDLNAAKDEVALSLRESIKKDFAAKSFNGKISLLDTITLTINDNSAEILQGIADIYSAKAVGSMALVNANDLSKISLGGDVNKALSYRFMPSKNVNFTLSENTPFLASSTLTVIANGNARIIWSTDYTSMQSNLTKKTKKEFTDIISDDKTISSATLSLFPPWKTTFPVKKDAITVKEKLPDYKL